MSNNKKKPDENLKKLRELASLYSNKHCFECNQKGPTYVNMTIGAFVCTKCSGLLRGLNPPQRVKSISMATFTPPDIEFLQNRGNLFCQKIWLGLFDPKSHPDMVGDGTGVRDDHAMKEFLIDKYEKKLWYVTPEEVEQQFVREKEIFAQHNGGGCDGTLPPSHTNATNGKEKSNSFSSARSNGDSSSSSYTSAFATQPQQQQQQSTPPLNSYYGSSDDPFSPTSRSTLPNATLGLGPAPFSGARGPSPLKRPDGSNQLIQESIASHSPYPPNSTHGQPAYGHDERALVGLGLGSSAPPTLSLASSSSSNPSSLVRRRSGNVTHSLSSSPKVLNPPFALKPPAASNKKKISSDSLSSIKFDSHSHEGYQSYHHPTFCPTFDQTDFTNSRNTNGTAENWNDGHTDFTTYEESHGRSIVSQNGSQQQAFGVVENGFEDSFSSSDLFNHTISTSNTTNNNHGTTASHKFVQNLVNPNSTIPTTRGNKASSAFGTNMAKPVEAPRPTTATHEISSLKISPEDKYSALAELDNAYHQASAPPPQTEVGSFDDHFHATKIVDESKNPFAFQPPTNGFAHEPPQQRLTSLTHKFGTTNLNLDNVAFNGWTKVDASATLPNGISPPKHFYPNGNLNNPDLHSQNKFSNNNNNNIRNGGFHFQSMMFGDVAPPHTLQKQQQQAPNPFIVTSQINSSGLNATSVITNPFL